MIKLRMRKTTVFSIDTNVLNKRLGTEKTYMNSETETQISTGFLMISKENVTDCH